MSFSAEDEKLLKNIINGRDFSMFASDDSSLRDESTDAFELNIDSLAFIRAEEADVSLCNDLGLDSMISATHHDKSYCDRTTKDFCIFEEVQRFDEKEKEKLRHKIQHREEKFNEIFRPMASSTPIPFDSSMSKIEMAEIDEICGDYTINAETVEIKNTRIITKDCTKAHEKKSTTEQSVDLLTSANWDAYGAPSIAPFENTRRTLETPTFCADALVIANEYSPSNSTVGKHIFFSQREAESPRNGDIIGKIEQIVESLIEDLSTGNTLSLQIKRIHSCNMELIDEVLKIKPSEKSKLKTVSFHRKTHNQRFCLIVMLLGEAYKFLKTNTGCNKREILYRHLSMVRDMRNLEVGIADMCAMLEIAPWEVGIVATSKGLVSGPLRIIMDTSDVIDCGTAFEGTALPHNFTAMQEFRTTAKFVLVVEKDTVFERLLKDDIFNRIGKHFILVTGKGEPDTCTRFFLNKMWTELSIPIYILVDADPYGVEIMLTYKHGSQAMSQQADSLAVPHIKWIGVHPSDLVTLNIPKQRLTSEDRKKIRDIMKRFYLTASVKEELKILDENGLKAEIEGLYEFSNNYIIDEYITNKIKNNLNM
ncbi:meiotic recombination protein W68 [Phlebotomus argentipes]|uniref:meiotic recombination protein W68 n=1 Tax=Phlebotomus argentipes TaxID=94469 RepID=UPI00289366D2|nr:meiotic recombination protein W68 [Phlebotomus argentipes]